MALKGVKGLGKEVLIRAGLAARVAIRGRFLGVITSCVGPQAADLLAGRLGALIRIFAAQTIGAACVVLRAVRGRRPVRRGVAPAFAGGFSTTDGGHEAPFVGGTSPTASAATASGVQTA